MAKWAGVVSGAELVACIVEDIAEGWDDDEAVMHECAVIIEGLALEWGIDLGSQVLDPEEE